MTEEEFHNITLDLSSSVSDSLLIKHFNQKDTFTLFNICLYYSIYNSTLESIYKLAPAEMKDEVCKLFESGNYAEGFKLSESFVDIKELMKINADQFKGAINEYIVDNEIKPTFTATIKPV